jgi:hypothetical protein
MPLHVCCGLNECRGQGAGGSGTMPGDGDCATANPHSCEGKNACAGQGGCGKGSAAVQNKPGENSCRGTGGCGSPIGNREDGLGPTHRMCTWPSTAGTNNGKPVWDLARKLFEKRMADAGKDVGPSPCCQDGKN